VFRKQALAVSMFCVSWLPFATAAQTDPEDPMAYVEDSGSEPSAPGSAPPDDANAAAVESGNGDAPADHEPEAPGDELPTIPVPGTAAAAGESGRRAPAVLEEIVVTAQKRSQSLSDVPISVTALAGEKLQDAGIESLNDLSDYTPNFKMVDTALVPNVYMRGVGSGSNQGFELSVGIFSDGIHLGRPLQGLAAFLDVERVEVLRGPQSILFGKNAIAGALSILSATPTESWESSFDGYYEATEGDREFTGMISGPFSDDLGARLAVRHRDESGDLDNAVQRRSEPALDELAGRLTFDWTPADWLDTRLKLEAVQRESGGRRFQTIDPGSVSGCTGENTVLDSTRATSRPEGAGIDLYNGTLTASIPLAGGELTLVTGANAYESLDALDADMSATDSVFLVGEETYHQLSQELRFTSPGGEFIDYIVGAFYQQSDLRFDELAALTTHVGTLRDTGVCATNLVEGPRADMVRDFDLEGRAISLFAQTTFNLSDRLRSTLGLRYVDETKTGRRELNLYQPGTQMPVDPATAAVFDSLNVNPHVLAGERKAALLLPSVNLQYDAGDAHMLYASYSRGAKSGSFDARNNNDQTGPTGGATNFEYQDELADAFEVGDKMRLGDTADLNLAVYHTQYADMQVSVFDGSVGFVVTNAGEARVQGVELDGRWRPGDALLLTGSAALLDFEWLRYEHGPCNPESDNMDPQTETCNLAGKQNQHTPKWTASLAAQHELALGGELLLTSALDVNFRDAHFTSGDLDRRGLQSAYFKYNARFALEPASGRWRIALVGKNLGDEQTLGITGPTALEQGGFFASTERRRTIGLEAEWKL